MFIDQFLEYMKAEREASQATVDTYRDALDNYARFLSSTERDMRPEDADTDLVRDWIESLMDRGLKATYVCKMLSAVKSLYRYGLRHGIVSRDPAHTVTGPKKEKTLPTFLKESETEMLFDGLDWNYDDIRDLRARTLLLVLYTAGLRRAELVGLKDSGVTLCIGPDGKATETGSIKVLGKRRKERMIPIAAELQEAMWQYRQMRDEQTPATDGSGAFFRNDKGAAMTTAQVYGVVRKYLSMVTTQKKRSPHVLRHSFATAMLNGGAQLTSVQKLLGHASLDTTQIYTHVTFEELKRSYAGAHPRAEAGNDE